MVDKELQQLIAAEVSKQIRQVKKDINGELRAFESRINENLAKMVNASTDDMTKKNQEVLKRIDDVNHQVVLANNHQVEAVNNHQVEVARCREMIKTMGHRVHAQVSKDIMTEVNNSLVPKINNMMAWVAYNNQDDQNMINQYRMGVQRESTPDMKALTTDKTVFVSEHVHLAFNDY